MTGEDGSISPTSHKCADINDEITQMKLPLLYDAAMAMIEDSTPEVQLGIWRLVVDKCIDRTGLDGKQFAAWASQILAN